MSVTDKLFICMWQMLRDEFKIKFSVLRAYYERLDRDALNVVAVVHAKYVGHFMLRLSC